MIQNQTYQTNLQAAVSKELEKHDVCHARSYTVIRSLKYGAYLELKQKKRRRQSDSIATCQPHTVTFLSSSSALTQGIRRQCSAIFGIPTSRVRKQHRSLIGYMKRKVGALFPYTLSSQYHELLEETTKPSRRAGYQQAYGYRLLLSCCENKQAMQNQSKSTGAKKIVQWIRQLLTRMLPKNFVKHVERKLMHLVKELCTLGNYDTMPAFFIPRLVTSLMRELKRTDSKGTFSKITEKQWRAFFTWLVDVFVRKLIRTYFHITIGSKTGNRLFLYQKTIWRQIVAENISKLVEVGNLQPVAPSSFAVTGKRDADCIVLKFVPKMTKVDNMKRARQQQKQGNEPREKFRPIMAFPRNYRFMQRRRQLLDVLEILTFEVSESSRDASLHGAAFSVSRFNSLFGFGVRGLQDFHPCFRAFKEKMQQQQSKGQISSNSRQSRPRLFFAKLDVKNCFDSIRVDLLLRIIEETLRSDVYFVRNRWLNEPRARPGMSVSRRKTSSSRALTKPALLRIIKSLLEMNIIKVEQPWENRHKTISGYFRQGNGIPQGSILSSVCCNLYLGHFERTIVFKALDSLKKRLHAQANVDTNARLLIAIRVIDDVLVISTDDELVDVIVNSFQSQTTREQYNIHLNLRKTTSTQEIILPSPPPISEQKQKADARQSKEYWFLWCGYMINIHNLSVRRDYSKFQKSSVGRYVFSTSFSNSRTRINVEQKLSLYTQRLVALYLDPILYDHSVNPQEVARLNFQELCLILRSRVTNVFRKLPFVNILMLRKVMKRGFARCIRLLEYRMRRLGMKSALQPSDARTIYWETLWAGTKLRVH